MNKDTNMTVTLLNQRVLDAAGWEWVTFSYDAHLPDGKLSMDEINQRVVACVNACAGIPTEVLEKLGVIAKPQE